MHYIKYSKIKIPTILLATLLTACSLGASSRASALTYQDNVDVQFNFNPVIRIDLSDSELLISNLAPGAAADSNIITVGASTNASYGYQLSATVGSKGGTDALINTVDNTKTFANLSSTKTTLVGFDDNTWGYSYCADSATNCEAGGSASWVSGSTGSTTDGYAGLPLDDNDDSASRGQGGVTLISTDGSDNDSVVQFKIGAKAGTNQVAGTYNNTINFYAVANPSPKSFNEAYADAGKEMLNGYYKMQDATPGICTAVDEGQVGEVIDTRDNTVYHIGKLADGKCWLLDNLALDLTNSAVLNGLNESNTHASNTTLNYLKSGGGTTSDKYATTGVVNWTDSPTYASSYSYSDPLVNLTNKDIVPTDATSTAGQYKVGGYYNYCAASAGSYCYGDGTSEGTSSGNATEDICPKGWRLPTSSSTGEYQALYNNARYNTYANYRSALRLPISGLFVYGSASDQGSGGNFWASTRGYNSSMHSLRLSTSDVTPSGGGYRYYGYSVRCVLGS